MVNLKEGHKSKYRLLIVDDSQTNIEYLKNILANQGYLIASTNNGASAIKKVKSNRFDLILLDIIMEGIDGYDVCRELKKDSSTKDIPIIFLTGLTDPDYLTKGFEYGAVDYVKKPFNKTELIARVQTHLELKRSRDLIGEKNKQLKETNIELEKLSIVASQTSNSVIIANSQGKVEWVNEGFTRLTGFTLEECRSLKGSNLIGWTDSKKTAYQIERCIKGKKSIVYAALNINKSGKKKWIQTTLTPILDDNQELVKLVAIDSDITYIKQAEREIKRKNDELEIEKNRSEELLLNILPYDIAEELKKYGKAKVQNYKMASVLFTDFKGFTTIAEAISPEQLVNELDNHFTKFDDIIKKYGLEKIKTIGDSYMCAGGIPVVNKTNPFVIVLAGLEIQRLIAQMNEERVRDNQMIWNLRLGIHTGELIAGVVGKQKFAYDIWGDTVNVASRMESAGEVNKVNISRSTYTLIQDLFDCTFRGKIMVKHKGEIDMFFVDGIKPEYSKNKKGIEPNEKFMAYLNAL